MIHIVREFPYIMYAVRPINGSTSRCSIGVFNNELGYYIKYQSEYDKSSYYKNKFTNSQITLDNMIKSLT